MSPPSRPRTASTATMVSPMAKVVNLNKFRKRKAKLEKQRQAETNRRLHGRSAAERAADDLRKKQLHAKVDGAKLTVEKGESHEDE